MNYPKGYLINGTTLEEMETIYISCYGEKPSRPICYYGGEFIALRADLITGVTREFPLLWQHNFNLPPDVPRLHEEAHMFSLLAERLRFRNNLGNQFTKRMWTGKAYNNVCPGDENLPIWHLPSEKKFGLHELYLLFMRDKTIRDEKDFRRKAEKYCGVPRTCLQKKAKDMLSVLKTKIKP